jgi:hypothetical protein
MVNFVSSFSSGKIFFVFCSLKTCVWDRTRTRIQCVPVWIRNTVLNWIDIPYRGTYYFFLWLISGFDSTVENPLGRWSCTGICVVMYVGIGVVICQPSTRTTKRSHTEKFSLKNKFFREEGVTTLWRGATPTMGRWIFLTLLVFVPTLRNLLRRS